MTSAGFDAKFLGTTAGIPVLTDSGAADAVELDGSTTIDYTHFSLAMSKSRKFASWVAWNIDGGEMKALSRTGIPFVKDPRVPAEFQTGDELYRDNRLDRGHLARRADLCWGPKAEAQKANKDSFFFTNITPQMDDFNQSTKEGLWGLLRGRGARRRRRRQPQGQCLRRPGLQRRRQGVPQRRDPARVLQGDRVRGGSTSCAAARSCSPRTSSWPRLSTWTSSGCSRCRCPSWRSA